MKHVAMKKELIAPCGANCAICMGFLRTENKCSGCRFGDEDKASSCVRCVIKNCRVLADNGLTYCHQCPTYPCTRLSNLDKRYRKNYSYSMIASLDHIKKNGIRSFLKKAKTEWTCLKCGGTVCVHRGFCVACGEIRYVNVSNKRSPLR